jgi:hypothetical protein
MVPHGRLLVRAHRERGALHPARPAAPRGHDGMSTVHSCYNNEAWGSAPTSLGVGESHNQLGRQLDACAGTAVAQAQSSHVEVWANHASVCTAARQRLPQHNQIVQMSAFKLGERCVEERKSGGSSPWDGLLGCLSGEGHQTSSDIIRALSKDLRDPQCRAHHKSFTKQFRSYHCTQGVRVQLRRGQASPRGPYHAQSGQHTMGSRNDTAALSPSSESGSWQGWQQAPWAPRPQAPNMRSNVAAWLMRSPEGCLCLRACGSHVW